MKIIHQWALYLGGQCFYFLHYVQTSLQLSWQSMRVLMHWRWISRQAVRYVVIRQLYFTGVQSLGWVLFMAVAVGLLGVYSIIEFALKIQDLTLIGSLIGSVLVQEVAPLLVALFLLMRSGVAVVTEVGNIQARGEPVVLASLGISEYEYLFMPRLLGFAISGLILTFVLAFMAVWFGGVVAAITNTLNFSEFIVEIRQGVSFTDMFIMIGKSLLYPVLIVLVLISQGHQVGDDPNQIPVRATYGMLVSLSVISAVDILIVLIQMFIGRF